MDFEFQVEFYVVSMAYQPEGTPWTYIGVESVRGAGGVRTHIDVLFVPGASDRYATEGYGTFNGPGPDQNNRFWLERSDFESFYAVIRSERPVFLRGGNDYMELYSGREPAGEGDTSVPRQPLTADLSDAVRSFLSET